jgi:hypothetical protein
LQPSALEQAVQRLEREFRPDAISQLRRHVSGGKVASTAAARIIHIAAGYPLAGRASCAKIHGIFRKNQCHLKYGFKSAVRSAAITQ